MIFSFELILIGSGQGYFSKPKSKPCTKSFTKTKVRICFPEPQTSILVSDCNIFLINEGITYGEALRKLSFGPKVLSGLITDIFRPNSYANDLQWSSPNIFASGYPKSVFVCLKLIGSTSERGFLALDGYTATELRN